MNKEREFSFTDSDFSTICNLVREHAGIKLSEAKRDMVYGRLSRRIRILGHKTFAQYTDYLTKNMQDELVHFTNAITTNLTSFFREPHHFEFLRQELLPELIRKNSDNRRIRIWSAGCSTGEEPYSISMVVKELVPSNQGWDVKILATDLDSNVLEKAKKGIYTESKLNGISPQRLKKWFVKDTDGIEGNVQISPEIRDMIRFNQLNLMNEWPMKGPFDFVFCRNVIIYFDKDTQIKLFSRFANKLIDQGHIFIGHSESLFKVTDKFKLLGKTIYRKTP